MRDRGAGAAIGASENHGLLQTEPDMKKPNPRPRAATRRIAGRAQQDHILNSYQGQQKLADGTACPECGAVYRDARWQWSARERNAPQQTCPACRRIHDRFPAGIVTLRGPLDQARKDDIVRLARHQEEAEKSEHPLNRIMSIEDNPEGIVITTTDIHLPRRIAEAVKRAFDGVLEIDFDENGYFVRVNWTPRA